MIPAGAQNQNDESRFGLTRAPFRAARLTGRGQSLSLRRVAPDGNCWARVGWDLLAQVLDFNWEWWALAALAFIYGAVVLMMIIVLVIKSGHTCYKKKEKASKVD